MVCIIVPKLEHVNCPAREDWGDPKHPCPMRPDLNRSGFVRDGDEPFMRIIYVCTECDSEIIVTYRR